MTRVADPRAPARFPEARAPGGRFEVLGVRVDALDMQTAVLRVAHLINGYRSPSSASYVCIRDVNGIMECQRDSGLLRIHNEAAMVTPDGMPLLWLGRKAGFR